eukprot:jgi/Mesvir1/29431/Mv23013-RA.1
MRLAFCNLGASRHATTRHLAGFSCLPVDRPQDRSQDGGWPSLGASRASPGGSSNDGGGGELPYYPAKSKQQFDAADARAHLAQTWGAAMQALESGNQVLALYSPGTQPASASASGAPRPQGKFLVKLKEAMAGSKDAFEA